MARQAHDRGVPSVTVLPFERLTARQNEQPIESDKPLIEDRPQFGEVVARALVVRGRSLTVDGGAPRYDGRADTNGARNEDGCDGDSVLEPLRAVLGRSRRCGVGALARRRTN